jgi:hypothetical protein
MYFYYNNTNWKERINRVTIMDILKMLEINNFRGFESSSFVLSIGKYLAFSGDNLDF